MRRCSQCGYCQEREDGSYYCNDLDEEIDPCEGPICTDNNYYS